LVDIYLLQYPGFGWDIFNSLSGNWCSAVFWIWDKNNVATLTKFLIVTRQSRISELLMVAWPARCTGSWEGTQLGKLTQTGERGILYHMMSCPVYKLGELSRGSDRCSEMGWVLFIRW